ncbi:MAG: DUF5706 domain-containing protein [Rickettsiales bacterium]|nr:DUF5706 domain-containing protein [Pseudomonadota bacterium]MDA0966529.1 DUF5706 domain-containing protein [Pseudomonadota bacterium]MDG4543391.1 DUF5706 domain-containing protein [Rickettsiales bacterium]MDG4545657.1 DUF5706 domain-containing protein [Rickettsiales bacterium]MDG4548106.1 DUF5706 domain-containing protein [Rickettsiales bacterium]
METKDLTTSEPNEDFPNQKRWEGLARGQILSSTVNKLNNAIRLIDQKAQVMLVINSITIPIGLSWIQKEQFLLGAIGVIFTAMWTMFFSIVAIYPRSRNMKKIKDHKPNRSNLLHWGDIWAMSEDEYLEKIRPVVNDVSLLTEACLKDIYDISRNVLRHKFFWIRFTYYSFFLGNATAILLASYEFYNQ